MMAKENHCFEVSESHHGCREIRHKSRDRGVKSPDNLPFMLYPEGAKTAALLVHGYTATPWEMRPLAGALAVSGIASLGVCLPGHGTSPEDLSGRSWEEWLEAVVEGYQLLSREFQSVYGMGMSTGCLLLLALAGKDPLRGLVLFSPYQRVLHRMAPYANWLRWLRPYHKSLSAEETDSHYYRRRPVAGVHQINRLVRSLRNQLTQIDCPVLAFNGEGDQTVEIESGRRLIDSLGSPVKIYAQYGPDVPHVLTGEENPCREVMFSQATRFVQELENPGTLARVR